MTRPRNAAPPHIAPEAEERYGHHIREALTTEGGHLAIGRGGFTLYFARGAYLSGHDCEAIKTACIAAGLPVIDSRGLAFEVVCDLAMRGPMVAVGEASRLVSTIVTPPVAIKAPWMFTLPALM